jgi:pyruvate kinase
MIRTKIVATMGPATATADALRSLFNSGVDVCRLNFSHGKLEGKEEKGLSHGDMLRLIRDVARNFEHPIAILGDLCGPKIRVGEVADADGTGGMPIQPGDELVIQRKQVVGGGGRVSCTYEGLIDDLDVGHRVLIEDGLLRFLCTHKSADEVRCNCTVGGVIKTRKGINLPDSHVKVPSITERDFECADWAVANDLDYLALSFVRKAEDLGQLREHLRGKTSDINLIAKIEKPDAIRQIDSIIDEADGLMVARGDLGVEMDLAEVPIIQKDLIRRCQIAGKPVIVATQMLQSMILEASPTRAEVSDVANAIFDGTDAVMLSGETSVGKFAPQAVLVMSHIAKKTEEYLNTAPPDRRKLKLKTPNLSAAVARGVWEIVNDLTVRLVVIWSQTGATARVFSKNRFPIPIVALSSDPRALRRMALHYGVVGHHMDPPGDLGSLIERVDRFVQDRKFADAGDRVVIVAGTSLGVPSTMNGVILHTVGETWSVTPAEHPHGLGRMAVGIAGT